MKAIKLHDETHSRLSKLGSVSDTFEDVIILLLNEHDKKESKK